MRVLALAWLASAGVPPENSLIFGFGGGEPVEKPVENTPPAVEPVRIPDVTKDPVGAGKAAVAVVEKGAKTVAQTTETAVKEYGPAVEKAVEEAAPVVEAVAQTVAQTAEKVVVEYGPKVEAETKKLVGEAEAAAKQRGGARETALLADPAPERNMRMGGVLAAALLCAFVARVARRPSPRGVDPEPLLV